MWRSTLRPRQDRVDAYRRRQLGPQPMNDYALWRDVGDGCISVVPEPVRITIEEQRRRGYIAKRFSVRVNRVGLYGGPMLTEAFTGVYIKSNFWDKAGNCPLFALIILLNNLFFIEATYVRDGKMTFEGGFVRHGKPEKYDAKLNAMTLSHFANRTWCRLNRPGLFPCTTRGIRGGGRRRSYMQKP